MRILFAGKAFERVWDRVEDHFSGQEVRITDDDHLREDLSWAEILVVRPMQVDESLLSCTGKGLRLIQQWGTGIEGIDVEACTARGIPVCNVPSRGTGNAEGVAELAVMLMMLLARRYGRCLENVARGRLHAPQGVALWKKRACVVGLGNLGECLVERLKGMGMDVVGVNRSYRERFASWGLAGFHTLEELTSVLPGCRFVLLAAASTAETKGFFSEDQLAAMDPDSFLINVARADLVDREALTKAIEERSIAGAGLDVFWNEPADPSDPLLSSPRVILTPHVGGVTDASLEGVAAFIAQNINRMTRKVFPLSCVNARTLGLEVSREESDRS